MATNNVKTVYFAEINDVPCGHGHKTYEAAEKCASQTIAAAKRGQVFYGSEWAKKINPDNADQIAMCVGRTLIAK